MASQPQDKVKILKLSDMPSRPTTYGDMKPLLLKLAKDEAVFVANPRADHDIIAHQRHLTAIVRHQMGSGMYRTRVDHDRQGVWVYAREQTGKVKKRWYLSRKRGQRADGGDDGE